MKIFNKVRDFSDSKVSMVILMDDIGQFQTLAEVIVSIGRERCIYEVYKHTFSLYMMELRLPYNRYLALMKGLRSRGWTLKPETRVDIFNRMIKI